MLDRLGNRQLLLVASTGGHLEQLYLWSRQWVGNSTLTWLTFDTPQSVSLLAKESDVRFMPYVPPRGGRELIRSLPAMARAMRNSRPDVVVSTGAAIAVPAMCIAKLSGRRAVYIESVARIDGLSLSARLIDRISGIERYVQHPDLSSSRWSFRGSVFDRFETSEVRTPSADRLRIVVTLGTIKPYSFTRLVNALESVLVPADEVVWQLGCTDAVPQQGTIHSQMQRKELLDTIAGADVVVSHAGVGSILSCLKLGKIPVLASRRRIHGEHVDDHQDQIADWVSSRGLAVKTEPERLTRNDLIKAAGLTSRLMAIDGTTNP